MGEVMTGMGIQNELNSMGNSGASSVGGYGRRNIRSQAGNHNQRQEQVMDDLGL